MMRINAPTRVRGRVWPMLDAAKKRPADAGSISAPQPGPEQGQARPAMPCQESPPDIPLFERALNLSTQAWAAQVPPFLGPVGDGDEDPSLRMAEALDRSLHYLLSRATLGLSPMGLA